MRPWVRAARRLVGGVSGVAVGLRLGIGGDAMVVAGIAHGPVSPGFSASEHHHATAVVAIPTGRVVEDGGVCIPDHGKFELRLADHRGERRVGESLPKRAFCEHRRVRETIGDCGKLELRVGEEHAIVLVINAAIGAGAVVADVIRRSPSEIPAITRVARASQ